MRVLLLAGVVSSWGCSALLDLNQCNQDRDCARYGVDGGALYCTPDHLCTTDVPAAQLCAVDPDNDPPGANVTIAGLFRLTGPNVTSGPNRSKAVSMAIGEINQGGGRKIRLVLCDTGGIPAQAKKALGWAADHFGAVASVGPDSSAEVIGLATPGDSAVAEHDFLVVSDAATAPQISGLDDGGLIWRTAVDDGIQARALATLVPAGTTEIADAYINTSYGQGFNASFIGALTAPLPVPTAKGFDAPEPPSDVVSFLQGQAPQVALVVADSTAPSWIAALGTGGSALMSTQYLFTDAAHTPSLFSLMPAKDVLDRTSGSAPAHPSGQLYSAFSGTYMGKYGIDPSVTAFVANAYDAAYCIAIAMGAVPVDKPLTGHGIAAGMALLSTKSGTPIDVGPNGFSTAYSALASGGQIDLTGVSGPIDFDPDTGDTISGAIELWKVDTSGAMPAFKTYMTINP